MIPYTIELDNKHNECGHYLRANDYFGNTCIVNVAEHKDGAVIVFWEWVGIVPDRRSRKPMDRTHDSSPELVRSELAKLRLLLAVHTGLQPECGVHL